jgi:hypothetical protein
MGKRGRLYSPEFKGLLTLMGTVADDYNNSMAEDFVSTLKRELISIAIHGLAIRS